MFIRLFLGLILLFGVLEFNLFAEEKIVLENRIATSNSRVELILTQLNIIKEAVKNNSYSSAIIQLVQVLNNLKISQREYLDQFFPDKVEDLEVSKIESINQEQYTEDNLTSLYTKRLKNSEGHTIDLNVMYMDPSIEEYKNIINNPDLVENLENIRLVKVLGKYPAIEKIMQESNYYERNIVLNNDTLINVIANGIKNKEIMEKFCNQIKFEELDKYLKN